MKKQISIIAVLEEFYLTAEEILYTGGSVVMLCV